MLKLILLLIAFSVLFLIPIGAQNAFAVLVGHDGLNNKHILIDINTGEATDLGPTTFTSRFSGMATTRAPVDTATSPTDATVFTHPSGTIFGVYKDETTGKDFVIQLDTTTGKANKIVEVVGGLEFRGVAFGPSGGFFAVEKQTKTLYTIDMITGAKTIVGAPGNVVFETNNLQFDTGSSPARFLALVNGPPADIISIDPTTGIGTKIGSLIDSTGSPLRLNGCAFVKNPDDGRWFTVARTVNPASNMHLFEVDVASGLVTDIGFLNQNAAVASVNICGLAFSSPAPVLLAGSSMSHEDPTIGITSWGLQVVENGICINITCWTVTEHYHQDFELVELLSDSTNTISVTVYCQRGVDKCNYVAFGVSPYGTNINDSVWKVILEKDHKGIWTMTVIDPDGYLGDVTSTTQIVNDGKNLAASMSALFKKPTPGMILNVETRDSDGGYSDNKFNDGITIKDVYAYPAIETSYEEPLEVEPLCLNENPNKRYTCAFDKVREWTIKNAEKALSQFS